MTSKRRSSRIAATIIAAVTTVAVALVGMSCSAAGDLAVAGVELPQDFTAQALSIHAVQVEWTAQSRTTYLLERRVNLTGAFVPVETGALPAPGNGRVVFVDTDVEPDTYYGYRIRATTTLNETSDYSPIRGARTPPTPGIAIETSTSGNYSDPDGYVALVKGLGVERTVTVGANDRKLIQPLSRGAYTVELQGIDPLCHVAGDATQPAHVDDSGLLTVGMVKYAVACRDPSKGQLTATIAVAGTGVSATEFSVKLEGRLAGQAATVQTKTVPAGGGSVLFNNLAPGDYQLTLSGFSENCEATDGLTREAPIRALDEALETFNVNCRRPDVNPNQPGYKLRGTWATPAEGKLTYTLRLDMAAYNDPAIPDADDVQSISGLLAYDASKLEFLSATNIAGSRLDNGSAGPAGTTPGLLAWQNFTGAVPGGRGDVGIMVFTFNVRSGASGEVYPTVSFQNGVDAVASANGTDLIPHIVIVDSPWQFSGGGSATSPTAEANGPYSGMVGSPIAFTANGSAATTGRTLVTYAWSFSDDDTKSGASPNKTFSAPGTYTATLTVTDNAGSTATDVANVTISGSGGSGTSGYVLRGTWSPVANGQVTYTLSYDLTGRDDPAIPGADDVFSLSGLLLYDQTKLRFTSAGNVSGSPLTNGTAGTPAPGTVSWQNFETTTALATGTVGVMVLNFDVLSGATGTVTPTVQFQPGVDLIVSDNGTELLPHTTVQNATLTLSSGGGSSSALQPLTWRNEFSSVDADGLVTLTVTLDLSADIAETAGPEALAGFVIDSLKWDPALLQFRRFIWMGDNYAASRQSGTGRITVLGGTVPPTNSTGLVGILVVQFAPVGATGSVATTQTYLKALTGTVATGRFEYLPKTRVIEGSFTKP